MRSPLGLAMWMLFAAGASAATTPPEPLSRDEIKSLFGSGAPFTATVSARPYTVALKPDGTGAMIPKTGAIGRNGTWRLPEDGLCTTWGKDPEQCFTVQRSGAKYEVLRGGKLAAVWTK